jgi:hypothetical protein
LKIAIVNPKQSLNAPSLIALTEEGVTMCTKDVHPANAPISSSPSLRIAVVNPKHSQNALSLIALAVGGIKILQSEVQSQSAFSSITSITS